MSEAARHKAAQWASSILANPRAVILDTETTGLDSYAEIVQIAIIDMLGRPLFLSYVRPSIPIPPRAQAIHGITDLMVVSAPLFPEVAEDLARILPGRQVVIYSADFDHRMLIQSAEARSLRLDPPLFGATYVDAMRMYAQWVGEWSDRHGGYAWHPLPAGDHTALGDCRACLHVLRRMATA